MYKFFITTDQIKQKQIEIIGNDVNHIKNVLRLKVGDNLQLCSKETFINYSCNIENINRNSIICSIIEQIRKTTEPKTSVHIFQGLPKSDKLEFIIEECTQIGVKEITPVIMKRTIVKLEEKEKNKKLLRWQKIAEVASKQSKRDAIPKINSIINFKKIFEFINDYDIVLVAYENEQNNVLKGELNKLRNTQKENYKIAVIIGPEGRNR